MGRKEKDGADAEDKDGTDLKIEDGTDFKEKYKKGLIEKEKQYLIKKNSLDIRTDLTFLKILTFVWVKLKFRNKGKQLNKIER